MRIKRFTGPTMPEALRQVKAVLGPEAVILDTADTAGGVQVTAAVDIEDLPADTVAPAAGVDHELMGEVRHLVSLVRQMATEQWRHQAAGLPPDVVRLHRALVAQGVDGVIAAALVRETAALLDAGTGLDAALARTLRTAPPPAGRRVRLFVGPPGDGKTTSIVKLAAQERSAGRRVLLVGADTYRIGAAAELEVYGRALGVPVARAADPGALARTLARAGDADTVLVDTAGAGPAEGPALAELAALAAAAGPEAGRTLVVSAATGGHAAWQTCVAFAALAPDACVLTKCDAAPGGPMLALLWRRGVPVTHVATGRRIPDDLEPATPDRLARCLLAA